MLNTTFCNVIVFVYAPKPQLFFYNKKLIVGRYQRCLDITISDHFRFYENNAAYLIIDGLICKPVKNDNSAVLHSPRVFTAELQKGDQKEMDNLSKNNWEFNREALDYYGLPHPLFPNWFDITSENN